MAESTFSDLEDRAKRGDPDAQYDLACIYERGTQCKKNIRETIRWLKLAAKQSHSLAQLYLALLYKEGKGVARNEKIALDWFRKSAQNHNAQAQYNLAVAYYTGDLNVEKNIETAIDWFHKAAELGHGLANFYLGREYYYGQNIERDINKAFEYTEAAALRKIVDAQHDLGIMYSMLPAEENTRVNAIVWMEVAADSKFEKFILTKNKLKKEIALSREEQNIVNSRLKSLRKELSTG